MKKNMVLLKKIKKKQLKKQVLKIKLRFLKKYIYIIILINNEKNSGQEKDLTKTGIGIRDLVYDFKKSWTESTISTSHGATSIPSAKSKKRTCE